MQETHRSGSLKQQNKQHKHGRHRSKGAIASLTKGKVAINAVSRKLKGQLKKTDRRNIMNQMRIQKRQNILLKKREIGGFNSPPVLIAVVPLGFETLPEKLINKVIEADSDATISYSKEHIFHLSVPRWKNRFAFTSPSKNNLYAILDCLKVVDSVIFVLSATSSRFIDSASEKVLSCLMSQGMPTTTVTLIDLEEIPMKKRSCCKQEAQKAIEAWLPDEKILALEKNCDALNLLRRLGSQKQRSIMQRDIRPHLLGEEVEYIPQNGSSLGVLKVSGYLRGPDININGLVHIPGWGDFQMVQMDGPPDPHPLVKSGVDLLETEVLEVVDLEKQTSLKKENTPDPIDAEQTWPTNEELEAAKKAKKIVKKIPKGMSEYQACWIPEEEEEYSYSDDNCDKANEDYENDAMEVESDNSDEEWEECEVADEGEQNAARYDKDIDFNDEKDDLLKLKAAREEEDFPDEVDTPQDVPARERFAKYRGLASFRSSPWDPKENLPFDYARIFQFENFDRRRKLVYKGQTDNLRTYSGCYVTIHIKDVPQEKVESRCEGQSIVLIGLLPYEHLMTVVNLVVKRSSFGAFSQLPIKSKDPVVIHCGFRRYMARPLYSQHTNSSKHKYERFFQPNSTVVATLYAPIIFPPASVLVFTKSGGGLIATGHVLSNNPDRLVIKRVILSGHPFKIFKHSAIIRFMFFNREDIDWFKPIELRTKHGRRGHIKEALGTHGHMKAVFDDQLKSQDTVLMTLYKRVFPPWFCEPVPTNQQPLYKMLPTILEDEEVE